MKKKINNNQGIIAIRDFNENHMMKFYFFLSSFYFSINTFYVHIKAGLEIIIKVEGYLG